MGVDLINIHPSPSHLKAGSKFEILATVVNNSPSTIIFVAGACHSPLSAFFKIHAMKLSLIGEDKVTDQMVEEKINEIRTKYASLAGVLERIHNMDLKENTIGLFGIDAMESLLKLRSLVILAS